MSEPHRLAISWNFRRLLISLTCRPRWLVYKSKDTDALQSLGKLRRLAISDPRIRQEWFDIRAEVAFHKETSALRHPNLRDQRVMSRIRLELALWTDCFRRGCWRRTHVGVGLMFFQQVSDLSTPVVIRFQLSSVS